MSSTSTRRFGLGAVGAATAVALLAACASSSSSKTQAGGGSSSGLKTRATSIGTVLVDGSGRTVYELVGATKAKDTCTGGCQKVWPAVTAKGTQVVVNGHPAFSYVRDTAAGQTNGQKVTDQWGLWLALDAKGNPIGAANKSAPGKSSAPGGGGAVF